MAFEIKQLLYNLPEVKKPVEKKLSFNTKLKYTLIVLGAFFVLANLPLYGLSANALQNFEFLQLIFATEFGSVISLGIGPIVMASIILQLLAGSGIMNIDTKTAEGRRYFQGLQKLGVIFFILFEGCVYVLMGGLVPSPALGSWGPAILIFQLMLGGFAIMFLDEVSQKWGFGSGVSLFIVAGVAWAMFVALFQFVDTSGTICLLNFAETACTGKIWIIIQSIINPNTTELLVALFAILITAGLFMVIVWAQSLKVEIPLSYERVRGYGIRWPLSFFYTSNIPVILTGALIANVQLFGSLLQNWLGHATILGGFSQGRAISGFAYWVDSTNLVEAVIRGTFAPQLILQFALHLLFYVGFSALFAVFWVKTSGMDETSQAKNILSSGLQIPGFRKDPRVLETILKRYILPLTIMGGIAIGAIAAFANSLGALTSGTALLLAVTITFQFYQNIAQQHAVDMHPAMKKFIA